MKIIGLDIGSITAKLVLFDGEKIAFRQSYNISERSEIVAKKAIEQALAVNSLARSDIDLVVATGYSRESDSYADLQKSTNICLYKGGIALFPEVRTIVEVGAEDATVISLDKTGRLIDYASNDKCAAGAGIFLEAMAEALGLSLDEIVEEAMKAESSVKITSTCTVFAEQEVLSHAFEDPPPSTAEIVAGIHESLVFRIAGLAMKVMTVPPILLCGGVALNKFFVKRFNEQLKTEVNVTEYPQLVAALGAAMIGKNEVLNRRERDYGRSRA